LELLRAGFKRMEQLDYERLNELYFKDRADGLKLSAVKLAMLATAWFDASAVLSQNHQK